MIVAISLSFAQLSAFAVERPVRRQFVAGRPLAFGAAAVLAIVGVAAIADGRATRSTALLGGLSAAAANGDATTASSADTGTRASPSSETPWDSHWCSPSATPRSHLSSTVPSEVDLGCGIALSPSPPAEPPGVCDDPAVRFAAKAAAHDVSVAVMVSCQWELLRQPLPGRGDEQYAIGHPAFDAYVRLRYEHAANQLTTAGVDRILWATCPYLSTSVGVDGLSERFVDSRDPARVDRLNAIIMAMATDRPDVEVLAFSEWVNERVDDPAFRPDGSHYEYRGHNPAADAFVEYVNASLSDDQRLPSSHKERSGRRLPLA